MASVAYSFQNVFSVPARAEQDVRAIQQQSNGWSQSEAEIRGGSRTPIRRIRGIHGINLIRGIEILTQLYFTAISDTCAWQEFCFLLCRNMTRCGRCNKRGNDEEYKQV